MLIVHAATILEFVQRTLISTATKFHQWIPLLQATVSHVDSINCAVCALEAVSWEGRGSEIMRKHLSAVKEILLLATHHGTDSTSEKGWTEKEATVAAVIVSTRSVPEDAETLTELRQVNVRLLSVLCPESVDTLHRMHQSLDRLLGADRCSAEMTTMDVYMKSQVQPAQTRKKSTPVRKQRPPSRACPSKYRAKQGNPQDNLLNPPGHDEVPEAFSQPPLGSSIGSTAASNNDQVGTRPRVPETIGYPLVSRNALSAGGMVLTVGTLNLNGLSKNSLGRKLKAVAHLMTQESIHILAVQETRLRTAEVANACLNEIGYNLVHHPARETAKLRLSSGTGFIIHSSVADSFTWVDLRNPHPYTTRWGRFHVVGEGRPLFIGCIYLPDSSRRQTNQTEFQQALDILRSDIHHFRGEGEVMILGDFNVQVGCRGCSKSAEMFGDVPPRFGSTAMTPRYGKEILQLVRDTGMQFLSGSTPYEAPQTFQRVSMRRGTVSCSVIDHIIASPLVSRRASTTRTLSFDTAQIQLGNFDHTVVYSSLWLESCRHKGVERCDRRGSQNSN